jgi:hypothetical protein
MRWFIALAALSLIGCTDGETDIVDADGDGIPSDMDCDDDDPLVNPDALERCNGVDDNCDGNVDEGVTRTYYADVDNDLYGDPNTPIEACELPDGAIDNDLDCQDDNFDINPDVIELCDDIDHNCDGDPRADAIGDTVYWRDQDNDGFGNPQEFSRSCGAPGADWVIGGDINDDDAVDCDDEDPLTNPGADELCGTAQRNVDENCNGILDDNPVDGQPFPVDADNDGFGSTTVTALVCAAGDLVDLNGDGISETVTTADASDCDDALNSIRPGAPERCDGIDNDCDPLTLEDEVATDTRTWWFDGDGDGAGDPANAQLACDQPTGFVAAIGGEDCDDTTTDRSPGNFETCDGIDNDCDTIIDNAAIDALDYWFDSDGDGLGNPEVDTQAFCDPPADRVLNADDCDDTTTDEGLARPWYLDSDGDGYGDPNVILEACLADQPVGYLADDQDCDDSDITLNPETVWYVDNDGDGFGVSPEEDAVNGGTTMSCLQPTGFARVSGDCLDLPDGVSDPATFNPDALDAPIDFLDQDCDGFVDDDAILNHGGTITSDTAWGGGGIHTVTSTVRIDDASFPELVIQPGAIVRFVGGASIIVEEGSLVADGVTFEHIDFDTTPGTWSGISFTNDINPNSPSAIRNSTIRHTSGFAISINGAEVDVENVTIEGSSAGPGIRLANDAVLNLSGSTITGNNGPGIEATSDVPQLGIFLDNTITGNVGRPIVVSATSLPRLFDTGTLTDPTAPVGNVLQPNGIDTVRLLSGMIDENTTWTPALGVDYEVDGVISVGDGSAPTLTIEDGLEAFFDVGSELRIGADGLPGALVVNGTGTPLGGLLGDPADELTQFTYGVLFDSLDGTPGTWDGVVIGDAARDSSITGLDLRNAGGNGEAALLVEGDLADDPEDRVRVTLTESRIMDSSASGLAADASRLAVFDTRFVDNQSHGFELREDLGLTSTIQGVMSGRNEDSGAQVYPSRVDLLNNATDTNRFFDNDLPIEITAGFVDDDSRWVLLDEDYYVSGPVRVENVDGPILDITEDVTVYFGDAGELLVGVGDQGSLRVNSELADPDNPPARGLVTMTALAVYEGTAPVNGAWAGVTIGREQRQSKLNDLLIDYAGQDTAAGALNFIGASLQPVDLRRVTVQNSGSHGLYANGLPFALAGPVVNIRESAFLFNDDIGVNIQLGGLEDLGGTPSLVDTDILDNGLNGLTLPIASAGFVQPSDGTAGANRIQFNNLVLATDGSEDFIEVIGGEVVADAELVLHLRSDDAVPVPNTFPIPYRLTEDDLRVRQGAVLTIDPGVTVEVEANNDMEIIVGRNDLTGGIVARGTETMPITFTSSSPVPQPGDWVGLDLGEECLTGGQNPAAINQCVLEYVKIGYAGGGLVSDRGALEVYVREFLVQPNPVLITNTVVHDSLSFGLMYYWDGGVFQIPWDDTSPITPMGSTTPWPMDWGCEDLDGNQVCDASDDRTGMCWDPVGLHHGQTNYFCDNIGRNTMTRDSANPYEFAICPNGEGPDDCSGAPAWAGL